MTETFPLVVFAVVVLSMMALDLGVFNRHVHRLSLKEATTWSITWLTLALTFNAGLYFWGNAQGLGARPALEFFTGYIIELMLSVDNIFVFVLIFSYFGVPSDYQHKVLFWGILGALIMRAMFITTGVVLVTHFHWIFYVFGGFLVFTGIKMAQHEETEVHPERNIFIRLCRKIFPVTNNYVGANFFVKDGAKIYATPLFLVLIMVETTDLVFALDSIPAIFAVTQDPLIIYSSNVFAILGLRSLYFVLDGIIDRFHYLKLGLAAVLSFVGLKMLLADFYKVPVQYSLLIICLMLAISILASLVSKSRIHPRTVDESVDDRTNGRAKNSSAVIVEKKKSDGPAKRL
jgi:tellurite resistance protein TerC